MSICQHGLSAIACSNHDCHRPELGPGQINGGCHQCHVDEGVVWSTCAECNPLVPGPGPCCSQAASTNVPFSIECGICNTNYGYAVGTFVQYFCSIHGFRDDPIDFSNIPDCPNCGKTYEENIADAKQKSPKYFP